ncbi:hypothetical protein ACROYT_G019019 [Oculina patagonica]
MRTKVFACLICAFVLLAVLSPECDAFGNGSRKGRRGRKRSLQKKNRVPEEMDSLAVKRHLCDTAERLGC